MNIPEFLGLVMGTGVLAICIGQSYGTVYGFSFIGIMFLLTTVGSMMMRYLDGKRPTGE